MNRRVYIVHGFEGNPHGNWFDWLCTQIKSTGAQAISLAMPQSRQTNARPRGSLPLTSTSASPMPIPS